MNRRQFLQSLSAIVPVWFAAKFAKIEPVNNVEFIVDEIRTLQGGITITQPSIEYWELINKTKVYQTLETEVTPGVNRGISPHWKPLVRMDTDGYHLYRNGETFSITSEGLVES